MPTDINIWKERVKQAVHGLADRELQRRAWLGIGPEESSPTEEVCQLVDDTDFEKHLENNDVGFSQQQNEAGRFLLSTIDKISNHMLRQTKPKDLIDDPRWIKVREAAKEFLALL